MTKNKLLWTPTTQALPPLDKNGEPIDCELMTDQNNEPIFGYFDKGTWWIELVVGHRAIEPQGDLKVTHWRPKEFKRITDFEKKFKKDYV